MRTCLHINKLYAIFENVWGMEEGTETFDTFIFIIIFR